MLTTSDIVRLNKLIPEDETKMSSVFPELDVYPTCSQFSDGTVNFPLLLINWRQQGTVGITLQPYY